MRRAIGIAGSPRREGNSTTLLRAALAGSAQAGAEVCLVHLNDLRYRGCQGCQPCTPDATCRLSDDLTTVLEALRDSDIWMLASPIYYDGVSGQLKTFFDRCRHLTTASDRLCPQLVGPRSAAIIVTYEDKPRDDYRDVAGRLAGYLQWMGRFVCVEVMAEGNLGPPEAAAGRADLLDRAGRVGRELVARLERPGGA